MGRPLPVHPLHQSAPLLLSRLLAPVGLLLRLHPRLRVILECPVLLRSLVRQLRPEAQGQLKQRLLDQEGRQCLNRERLAVPESLAVQCLPSVLVHLVALEAHSSTLA